MTNRFPLTINPTNSTIEELPAGDNLDLSGSNIANVNTITAIGNVQGSYILGNGSQLTGISTGASGSNTQIQFNDDGQFNGDLNLTYNKTNTTLTANNLNISSTSNLGAIGNVTITGGTNGQVLTTDGAGVLSFATVNAASYTLEPVKSVSVTAITLTGTKTIDGVSWAVGDRVLLVGQSNQNENGIWIVSSGNWTRANDFTTGASTFIGGVLIPVTQGTVYGGTLWQCSTPGILNVGTTINFVRQGIDGIISIGTGTTGTATAASVQSLAIGDNTKASGSYSLSIGLNANATDSYTTAVGMNSKAFPIGSSAFGVGANAYGARSVALGECNAYGDNSVSIGNGSKANTGGVSIGANAGSITQSVYSVAVGFDAGRSTQGIYGVALGHKAGNISQGGYSVAIGYNSGNNTQGSQAVAVGYAAGTVTQQTNGIAIGTFAGAINQGANSIAIGFGAGHTNMPANSIFLNATGSNANIGFGNSFYVKPIRNSIWGDTLYYDTATGEVTYAPTTVPNYTIATKPASGTLGQMIAISDATPGGRLAFWDTTNNRWSYVNDNSAV